MNSLFKELHRTISVVDPLVIKLNRHQYGNLDYYTIICGANLAVDENYIIKGEEHQHPKMISYNKICVLRSRVKYTILETSYF